MKVLLIEPKKAPRSVDISDTLGAMQELVGGTIQAIYPFDEPVALICNDEGKLLGSPPNRALHEIGDIICGTFFICGAPPNTEHFTSLNKAQINTYTERFRYPETFLSIGDVIFALPDL